MNYSQSLPTYRHDFENELRFLKHHSEHYVFHYFPDSEAERDIDTIMRTQEAVYVKIMSFLGVAEPNRSIEYYFYPDKETKITLMGDDWYAQSIYNEFRIHVLYTKEIKPIGPHEDTHLLSLPWDLSIGFFQEGLAEHMVGHAWDGTLHKKYVKDGYAKNIYPPLIEFMRHEQWLETDDNKAIYFYSLAGAFTSFLIKSYGRELLEHFYRKSSREKDKEENSDLFQQIYNLSITEAEREFKLNLHG